MMNTGGGGVNNVDKVGPERELIRKVVERGQLRGLNRTDVFLVHENATKNVILLLLFKLNSEGPGNVDGTRMSNFGWVTTTLSTYKAGYENPAVVYVSLVFLQVKTMLRKASEARVNRRLRRYYLIVLLLPNIFTLACLLFNSL